MPLRRFLVLALILTGAAALAPSAGAARAGDAGASAAGAAALADPGCTIASTRDCDPGRTIRRHNRKFLCDRALRRYGRLPLKVVITFSRGRRFAENGAIDLDTGCAGDRDPQTIDLIVHVQGNGRTRGPGVDAFKVRQRAGYNRGIQVTGRVNCGPRAYPAVHQDGVQLQGGRDIAFVDFKVGRYNKGRSTCQGAGGAFFYSGAQGYNPQNVDVVRGRYIACNHSLFVGGGTGTVRGARFRSGRTDGSDPKCRGFHGSPACDGAGPRSGWRVTLRNVTCQRWNSRRDRWGGN